MAQKFDVTALPMNMRLKILPGADGCWEWLGATNSKGYGCVTNGRGKSMLTHRRAYQELVGEIPAGMTIDHLCRNKVCVNTDHMEVVTRGENSRRALAAQTHCKRGHELAGENLRLKVHKRTGYVHRECRACGRYRQRKSRALKAVA